MNSDTKPPPPWQPPVRKEELMEVEHQMSQMQKELENILTKCEPKQLVGRTQEELEAIFAKSTPEQVREMRSDVLRYNQTGVLIKILFVNREFLTGVINHYDSDEPVILATLARCTFELFLGTRDAFSSPENFRKFNSRTVSSLVRFYEKALDWATIQQDGEMMQMLQWELVRLEQLRKIYEIILGPFPSIKSLNLNFKDLATQFGLGTYYDFDYGILSSFIHPSLLYVAVAPQISDILSGREGLSTMQRDGVKAWSLDIALDFSQRLLKFIQSICPTLQSS